MADVAVTHQSKRRFKSEVRSRRVASVTKLGKVREGKRKRRTKRRTVAIDHSKDRCIQEPKKFKALPLVMGHRSGVWSETGALV